MHNYNFDEPLRRRGTGCMKWDEPEGGFTPGEMDDVIPMWVADMDFATAPCVHEAVRRRAEHGAFGYTYVADDYYEAVIDWYRRRYDWTSLRREHILYTTGVVPAVSCALKALTMPGERVFVLTPVYNCFFSSIRNSGCEIVASPLERYDVDGGRRFSYRVDWADFEQRCADEKCTVFLLCNPHNPAGVLWSRDDLQRMGDICQRHGVVVVSDEIHGELSLGGRRYVPYATVGDRYYERAVVLSSPSKAFNIAGLQMANIFCPDPDVRRRIDRAVNINEVCDVGPFGPVAVMAAYREGEPWLTDLCQYLTDNYRALSDFMAEHLPQLPFSRLDATYLVWVDIAATGLTSDALADRLLREGHVRVSPGSAYGQEGYIRLNIACPRRQMLEGLRRIAGAHPQPHPKGGGLE